MVGKKGWQWETVRIVVDGAFINLLVNAYLGLYVCQVMFQVILTIIVHI